MRIALLTGTNLSERDEDESLLVAAFERAGAEARVLAWDERGTELRGFDAAVVRSTWNYVRAREALCAFLERAAAVTRVFNAPAIVRWNTDKSYLRELPGAVPTIFDPVVAKLPWSDVVLKPRVGAGSQDTRRFRLPAERAEAEAFLRQVTAGMMAQPYLRAVEESGERSLVFIDGELTHAVRKSARFSGEEEHVTRASVAEDELAFASELLRGRDLLYARVDLVRDGDVLRLMELELTEPSLFLLHEPTAAERLARATLRRIA